MRFAVDAWDPAYESNPVPQTELTTSTARMDPAVETEPKKWGPVPRSEVEAPSAILFVDGVRRLDARVWIMEGEETSMGICASYAAGVVSCCAEEGAHVTSAEVRRGLFTTEPAADDIATRHGTWAATRVAADPQTPASQLLVQALQRKMIELEGIAASNARAKQNLTDDLLVVDGPLRCRTLLPRAVGLIKTHQVTYLPPELATVVNRLGPGERTPVFLLGTTWERFSWYLKLPTSSASPWAGVVRIECASELPVAEAVEKANLTQAELLRFASEPHKDPRAPQNLYPIAGLESQLRRRLGDSRLLSRSLQSAARGTEPSSSTLRS